MDQPRPVFLVSNHPDTAELYSYALQHAGFSCITIPSPEAAAALARERAPSAIVLHVHPTEDPAQLGEALRQAAPAAALIGLFSMQLPVATLKQVLRSFDDVVLIPCSPDALLARLLQRVSMPRRRQKPA